MQRKSLKMWMAEAAGRGGATFYLIGHGKDDESEKIDIAEWLKKEGFIRGPVPEPSSQNELIVLLNALGFKVLRLSDHVFSVQDKNNQWWTLAAKGSKILVIISDVDHVTKSWEVDDLDEIPPNGHIGIPTPDGYFKTFRTPRGDWSGTQRILI